MNFVGDNWQYLFESGTFSPKQFTDDLRSNLKYPWVTQYCDEDDGWYTPFFAEAWPHCPSDLRLAETAVVQPLSIVDADESPQLIFIFDLRPWTLKTSVFSLLQTGFICVMLCVGAMTF